MPCSRWPPVRRHARAADRPRPRDRRGRSGARSRRGHRGRRHPGRPARRRPAPRRRSCARCADCPTDRRSGTPPGSSRASAEPPRPRKASRVRREAPAELGVGGRASGPIAMRPRALASRVRGRDNHAMTDPIEFTPSQAAARLGTSTRSVQRWIAHGTLPARRVGGRWRVASDALDAFERAKARQQAREAIADPVTRRLVLGHPHGLRRQPRRDRGPDPPDGRSSRPPDDRPGRGRPIAGRPARPGRRGRGGAGRRRRCAPPRLRLPQRERRLRRARRRRRDPLGRSAGRQRSG